MQATEISAPQSEATLCGKRVMLRFDHNMMRLAEVYFQQTTGYTQSYYGIVDLAAVRAYGGLGALAYGAVASVARADGKNPIGIEEFDRQCTYEELRACSKTLMEGVLASLPKKEGSAKKE